jgi:hypothetical protein
MTRAEMLDRMDHNSMTDAEKTELSFVYLCRRLLDIDPACHGGNKGCPWYFAALPMITDWRTSNERARVTLPTHVDDALRRLTSAYGEGRWCEFQEALPIIQEFLGAS